jgi:hypothetical protein
MEALERSDRVIRLRNQHGRIVAEIQHACLVIQWKEKGVKGRTAWPVEQILKMMQETESAGA